MYFTKDNTIFPYRKTQKKDASAQAKASSRIIGVKLVVKRESLECNYFNIFVY